jgi:hypothetical protein
MILQTEDWVLNHRVDAQQPGYTTNMFDFDFSTMTAVVETDQLAAGISYIERLALAPLESVAETMRARVGVGSSLRRSFKDKLGWKPAIILSRKDWHCVQDRAVVW